MICPQCQEVTSDTARFCSGCGLSFASFNTPTERIETTGLPETMLDLDPLVGQVLDGKYEIGARLGEGGMGAVYRARRVHIGDEVAVKVLLRKFVADSGLVERFRREARAAAQLRHPNIVTIYDYGEARSADAPAYIVMELVEGESLRQLLRREGRLAPERAVALMRDICAGVGAAHRRQIFHRDLKPDNIIVLPPDEDRERETVKVVDFGIAKLRDAAGAPTLTQTGVVMGTPHYMSPEQCRGDQLDARSDVYSLGAVLYEMFAGTPPFTASSYVGILTKHITEAPPPLPAGADAPPALAAFIMRTLAKNPDARPTDATELARELRAAEEAANRQREAEAQRQREEEQRRRQAEQAAQAAEEERRRKAAAEAERRKREAEGAERRRQAAEESERRRAAQRVPALIEETPVITPLDTPPPSIEAISRPAATTLRQQPTKLRQMERGELVIVFVVLAIVLIGIGVKVNSWSQIPTDSPEDTNLKNSMKNRIGMEFVWIPPGNFMMGAENGGDYKKPVHNGDDYEKPVHRVTISEGLYMGKYEVTQAQWQAVMGNNPSQFKGDNLPVAEVSWDDAIAFIARMNAQNDGYTYRLPSEAEWEYAARAGTTGDYAGDLDAMAWYSANSGNKTHSVGTKLPNAFGLFDMHGNVWEWCQDWYHNTYAGAPADGSAWLSGGEQHDRVLRGGSWDDYANYCRSAFRRWYAPNGRGFGFGLRVVAVTRT